MKDTKKQIVLAELIQKELDGCLTDQEFNLLQSMLKEDTEAVNYYIKTIRSISAFSSNSMLPSLESVEEGKCQVESFQSGIWKALAEAEKAAPAVEVVVPREPTSMIQKVQHQKLNRTISKSSRFTLVATAAAIVLIFVFSRFAPQETGLKVAVLSDSINAKWADMDGALVKGASVFTSRKSLLLREGIVELLFDNQAKVVIESPAEFEIVTGDQVKLNYGRLYATIPQSAIGFAVQTYSARIIDLGTEFGVDAIYDGSTELHVYKGKTTLIAGSGQNDKELAEVIAGNAKKVRYTDSQINDITLKESLFVREIDSSKQFIWKGQSLDLASMVSGGDGFTKGQVTSAIDPATGEIHPETVQAYDRFGSRDYTSVANRTFIDGVFVPDDVLDADVVSSAGHTFAFPKTDNSYFSDITSSHSVWMIDPKRQLFTLSLNQTKTEKATETSLIFLHSNAGITFNLDEIRQSLPQLEIDRFKALCGISKGAELNLSRSEFWVLLDGICIFHYQSEGDSQVSQIDIPIKSGQKFLTLATTYGGDGIGMDWCMFENPQLIPVMKSHETEGSFIAGQ
jgi:hypothetical protein